jgi:hypothetical protein
MLQGYLLHAGFLLGFIFLPDDGGDMYFRNVIDFQQTTLRYIPKDKALQFQK